MRLSNDPVAPGGRGSGPGGIGEVSKLPLSHGVTGDFTGKYLAVSGDT